MEGQMDRQMEQGMKHCHYPVKGYVPLVINSLQLCIILHPGNTSRSYKNHFTYEES